MLVQHIWAYYIVPVGAIHRYCLQTPKLFRQMGFALFEACSYSQSQSDPACLEQYI